MLSSDGGSCTFCAHGLQAVHPLLGAIEYFPLGHISQRDASHTCLDFVGVTSTIAVLKHIL
jgi:hypothetical protein